MIKVLARSTNTAKQFCGQRKGGKFKCEHFTKFYPGLHEIFASTRPTSHLLSFVSINVLLAKSRLPNPRPARLF